MKLVALLSGGKDSTWNMVHCQAQGHEIVALGTLSPPAGQEEMDSYLYQTVGQDGIDYIAQALELPLYRRTITGTALNQDLQYRVPTLGDETEDLFELLQQILDWHPEVKGVAVGAILSTYQRVRVEHVCARLGLTCVAYLWQRSQLELLHEMKEAGMVSILVKVAGAGLTAHHLGQNVVGDEMMDTLASLHARFGLHLCGEGGEYETFTLDCPLFKRRIELLDSEVITTSAPEADRFSTVAYLRLKSARLIRKDRTASVEIDVPPFDQHSLSVKTAAQRADAASEENSCPPADQAISDAPEASIASRGIWHAICGVHAFRSPSVQLASESNSPIAEEVASAFANLATLLEHLSLTLAHIVHVDLLLADMSDFGEANAAYVRHFPHEAPPTRATVAVQLTGRHRVELGVIANSAVGRRTLHVQSLSYWAPANIGPYSQAVSAGGRHFIAGQIGLIPASLILPSQLPRQFALSSQHVRRIIEVAGPGSVMDSCICWIAEGDWSGRLAMARAAWRAWNAPAPVLFVEARQLPRGALVEWQCTFAEQASTEIAILLDLQELASSKLQPLVVRTFLQYNAHDDSNSKVFGDHVATSLVRVGHLGTMERDSVPCAYLVFSA